MVAYVLPWIATALERSLLASALSSAALAVVFCLVAVEHDADGVDGIGRAVVDGPARLLSVTLPVHDPRWLFVTPVLITWLAAAVVGETAARTRSVAVPVATGFALFTLAYVLTAARDVRVTMLAVVTVVLWGVWTAARRALTHSEALHTAQSETAPATLAIVGALGVVVATIAGTAATALPRFDDPPAAPHRDVPLDRADPISPLTAVASLRASASSAPGGRLFSVTTTAPVAGYTAIAELDTYDGGEWRLTRTFVPSGGNIPALDADRASTARIRVAVDDPRALSWMPYVPTTRAVDGVQVAFDRATGMVVPARPLRTGDSYTVRAAAATTTVEGRPHTDTPVPIGAVTDYNDLAIPPGLGADVDKVLADFESETRVKADDPVAFLVTVANDLHSDRYRRIDRPEDLAAKPKSPASTVPGQVGQTASLAFSSVVDAVTNRRAATPEQYATLYAMVARRLSVPARVVTGFRVAALDAHGTARAGRYDLTAADAWTWVELDVGTGWTPSDPTPSNARLPHVTTTTLPASTNGVTTTTAAAIAPDAAGAPSVPLADPVHRARPGGDGLWRTLFLVAGTIVLAVPLAVRARRWRMGMRRRRGDARTRVVGAWHEALDALERARLGNTDALTVEEVAASTGARFGPGASELVAAIGGAADVALYSSAPIDDTTATRAWERVARLPSQLRRKPREPSSPAA